MGMTVRRVECWTIRCDAPECHQVWQGKQSQGFNEVVATAEAHGWKFRAPLTAAWCNKHSHLRDATPVTETKHSLYTMRKL